MTINSDVDGWLDPSRAPGYTSQIEPMNHSGRDTGWNIAIPAASFSYRAPSPPHIHIGSSYPTDLVISFSNSARFAREGITEEEFQSIFKLQHAAQDNMAGWKYDWRRRAQLITPVVYLGPSSAAKDREFLRSEGITMLMVVRDTKSAMARVLSGDKVAAELGIASTSIDVAGNQELIAQYPRAVRTINDHLLATYRKQKVDFSQGLESGGHDPPTSPAIITPGKVLVFCESGNDRSVTVVAAYLMAMYGMNAVHAIQFIQSQRFCVALDDNMKNLLKSFEDIVTAQNDAGEEMSVVSTPRDSNKSSALDTCSSAPRASKRRFEETMDVEMEDSDAQYEIDAARFEGRSSFTPYI